MKRLTLILLVMLPLLGWGRTYSKVWELDMPRTDDATNNICDPDDYLLYEYEDQMNDIINHIEQVTGVQTAVVIIDSLSQDVDAFNFTVDLFNKWGIGSSNANTGVLIFVAAGTRDVQIRTGAGIEPYLTDAECARIIEEDMRQSLVFLEFGNALIYALQDMEKIILDPVVQADLVLHFKPSDTTPYFWYFMMVVAFCVILTQVYVILRTPKCPVCGRRMWQESDEVLEPRTYRSEGRGVRHLHCRKHPEQKVDVEHIILRKLFVVYFTMRVIRRLFLNAISSASSSSSSSSSSSYSPSSFSSKPTGGSYGGGRTYGGGAGGKF